MDTLHRISHSTIFWQIMFFLMSCIAVTNYVIRPRVIIKTEHIYLIYEHPSDEHPMIETRAI
ncbi:MAG: hypothetical protein ACTSYX_02610 [Candidatus Thorarchaeota archaeon]